MADISDKWSCSTCRLTVVRGAETFPDWFARLGHIQITHARVCTGTRLPK